MAPIASGPGYLQQGWAISNQFGQGHTWVENAAGSSTFHLSFTGTSGNSVAETVTANTIRVVYAAGSLEVDKLANGNSSVHISLRPGACQNPSGVTAAAAVAATGATVSAEVDANGNPVGASDTSQFEAVRAALACRTAPVASELRTFMAQANMPIPTSFSPPGGQVHTEISIGCARSLLELGIAAGAFATSGLDFGLSAIFAVAGYTYASEDYYHTCVQIP